MEKDYIEGAVSRALAEDRYDDDITVRYAGISAETVRAYIESRAEYVLCGIEFAVETFKFCSPELDVRINFKDGENIKKHDKVLEVYGAAGPLLAAERTAINFLSFMSAIATRSRAFSLKLRELNPGCGLYDTRKTLPGLRAEQKYAVRTGGGLNHRMDLSDQVLVKENHISAAGRSPGELIDDIARRRRPGDRIEVEVESIPELLEVLERKAADIVLLDNFSPADVERAVAARNRYGSLPLIEVSGGVSEDNLASYAVPGVDRISSGRLAWPSEPADFSLLLS